MSYILEALKMSEQSRRQRVDGLHYSLLPAVEEATAPRQFRPYIWLAGALFINAMALALWWRPAPPPAQIQMAKALPETPPAAPRAPVATTGGAPEARPALRPAQLPVAPPVLTVVAAQPRASVAPRPAPETPPPETKPRAAAPDKTDETTNKADNSDGTSASLMKQLPPINIAGYIRDAEANRLVMVNDRLLREGDELAPGLKLEKILDDSVIFNFRGHRFKR